MDTRKPPRRATPGSGAQKTKAANMLFYGDNLEVLRNRVKDETVDLCYMDPPFNSKRNYNQIYNNVGSDDRAQAQAFIDTWKWDDHARAAHRQILANEQGRFPSQLVNLMRGLHPVLGEGSLFAYLCSMALRIVEIHRVLKPTGSFYLHCDPTSSHYLKLVLDGVFCAQGGDFRNEIVWKRSSAHSDTGQGAQHYGRVSDTILFYAKSSETTWVQQYLPYDPKYIAENYKRTDPDGRVYRIDNIQGPGGAAKGNPFYEFLGVKRYWRYSRERMEELYKRGRIIQTRPGAVPQYKRYLDEMPGVPVQNIWTDIPVINNRSHEALGYPTQKPIGLLERILMTSSREGDVVLDPCCGCGTTIAASEKLGRRWIGIDITYQSISLVLQRLEDQAGAAAWPELEKRINLTGIPRDMESAVALAHKRDDRVRKEFEKWAVLTYTNNRAVINEKKGADGGIDGRVYFLTSATENASMVLQVKSGIVDRADIAQLRGDMKRDGAEMAILITLVKPTSKMTAEAKADGFYHHHLMDRDYDRIQIVTIQEIVEQGQRLDIPLLKETLRPSARPKKKDGQQLLPGLDGNQLDAEPDVSDMVDYLKRGLSGTSEPVPKKAPAAPQSRKKIPGN